MKEFRSCGHTSFETPNLSTALQKKRENRSTGEALLKISATSCLCLLLITDLYRLQLSRAHGSSQYLHTRWWAELALTVVVVSYLLYELLLYLTSRFFYNYVDVTEAEQQLLAVRNGEHGFRRVGMKETTSDDSKHANKLTFSPSEYKDRTFPLELSSLTPGSPLGQRAAMSSSHLDDSVSHSSPVSSQTKSRVSPMTLTGDEGSFTLNKRSPCYRRPSAHYSSPRIDSVQKLESFLEEESVKERNGHLVQAELNASSGYSFWSANRTVADYLPILKRFQYQVAPRTSAATTGDTKPGSDTAESSKHAADGLWKQMSVSQSLLDIWTENLRYWLGQTIVRKLAQEIIRLNKELRSAGSEETAIGEVSVSTLKNLAFVKSSTLPTLNNIIPYLEITSHQDYLVQRIKALGNDGCVAEFNWDGGSAYNGKMWEDYLPTDSAILMHLFCSYLDARLPANPKYPDGKSFTSQHFIAVPEKPNFKVKKDYLTLYQTKVNSPHYNLILGEEIVEVPKGRNNLFHALLMFVLHVRDKHNGMLGQVSFNSPGINILWILSHKYR